MDLNVSMDEDKAIRIPFYDLLLYSRGSFWLSLDQHIHLEHRLKKNLKNKYRKQMPVKLFQLTHFSDPKSRTLIFC